MSREIAIERAVSHSVPKTYKTLAKHPHIQLLTCEVKKGRRR